MSFDWTEYLKLANDLAGKSKNTANEQARLRSSISRAYFAAHCTARNFIERKENRKITKTGDAHEEVIRYFSKLGQTHKNKDFIKISSNLNSLKIERTYVDYRDKLKGNLSQKIVFVLKYSDYIVNTLTI